MFRLTQNFQGMFIVLPAIVTLSLWIKSTVWR